MIIPVITFDKRAGFQDGIVIISDIKSGEGDIFDIDEAVFLQALIIMRGGQIQIQIAEGIAT